MPGSCPRKSGAGLLSLFRERLRFRWPSFVESPPSSYWYALLNQTTVLYLEDSLYLFVLSWRWHWEGIRRIGPVGRWPIPRKYPTLRWKSDTDSSHVVSSKLKFKSTFLMVRTAWTCWTFTYFYTFVLSLSRRSTLYPIQQSVRPVRYQHTEPSIFTYFEPLYFSSLLWLTSISAKLKRRSIRS